PPPPRPRRKPPAQQRDPHDRPDPLAPRPPDRRLHSSTAPNRQNPPRSDPLPQTPPDPPDLPAPHPPKPDPTHRLLDIGYSNPPDQPRVDAWSAVCVRWTASPCSRVGFAVRSRPGVSVGGLLTGRRSSGPPAAARAPGPLVRPSAE